VAFVESFISGDEVFENFLDALRAFTLIVVLYFGVWVKTDKENTVFVVRFLRLTS